MARLEFEIESTLPPEAIVAGLTDMTLRRPDIWPGLNPRQYAVYDVAGTWAVIREGNSDRIWARERYDWSTPGLVTWTVQESGFAMPGDSVAVEVRPRDGGGSRLHVTWQRRGSNPMGRVIIALNVLTRGLFVKQSLRAGLRRMESGAA